MVDLLAPDWPPDPDDELYWLLRALTIERDELHRRLGAARGEIDRLRAMLRRWHAQHRQCHGRGPTNQGHWGARRW